MSFSERAKTIALAIVHVFETGKPLGDYGAVAVLTDGAGFSVGINQFTHRSGSLALVLDRFARLGGDLSDNLTEALPDFRAGRRIALRSADAGLKRSLKALGSDPLWRQAQREIAFEKYLKPALDACEGSGFQWPLSLAVVYDSINQGSYPKVRDRVSADPSNEKAWIAEYCADRKAFLKSSAKSIVRGTVYRPNFFLGQIANANWSLNLPIVVNGYKITDAILFPTVSVTTPTVDSTPTPPAAPDNQTGTPLTPQDGSSPSNLEAPAGAKVTETETVVETQTEAGDATTEKTTETTTESFTPKNIPAFIPRFGWKQRLWGLVPGGGLLATIGSWAANQPPWVVFLCGAFTGIALTLFVQLIITHRKAVITFITECYKSMADPTQNNLIPTPAAAFVGQRMAMLTSAVAPMQAETADV